MTVEKVWKVLNFTVNIKIPIFWFLIAYMIILVSKIFGRKGKERWLRLSRLNRYLATITETSTGKDIFTLNIDGVQIYCRVKPDTKYKWFLIFSDTYEDLSADKGFHLTLMINKKSEYSTVYLDDGYYRGAGGYYDGFLHSDTPFYWNGLSRRGNLWNKILEAAGVYS